MGRGEIRGYERGARKRQAMQSGTHFAKTGGFRLHGARLFHACWGAAPIPAEHKNCVLERWINPSAARFCKSLVGGQLSAAPPLFPVVHSLPPAPYPAPEYANLQEVGIRLDVKSRARVDLAALLKKEGRTRVSISEKTGLGVCTVQAAIAGKNVTMHSADKIAEALGRSRLDLFIDVEKRKTLDANTVRGYHRLISSILTKAVKWGFIPFNPAANAELPKLMPKEAAHLDEEDARRLLELLQNEPAKYRAAISFDLLSGLRRGELLGLRWSDVDFENETVTIVQTSSYVPGVGIYTDTPKNKTSARPLKLSRSAFFVLRQVQEWQEEQRALCGDRWKDKDGRIFTNDEGAPIHPDALSSWFGDFTRRNGFTEIHVHSLRHSYASLLIAEGTPLVVVSRRLGHAQVSTTANIYAHVIASADEKAAQITEKFVDIIVPNQKKKAATA